MDRGARRPSFTAAEHLKTRRRSFTRPPWQPTRCWNKKAGDTWLAITEGLSGVYETPELSHIRPGACGYACYPKPRLLVPQRKTVEIPERIDAQGRIVTALDEPEARKRLEILRNARAESADGVCLCFSFLNPLHEQRLRELIYDIAPSAQVYLSSEVLPQIREYSRLATTVTNAYVAPVVIRYVDKYSSAPWPSGVFIAGFTSCNPPAGV